MIMNKKQTTIELLETILDRLEKRENIIYFLVYYCLSVI